MGGSKKKRKIHNVSGGNSDLSRESSVHSPHNGDTSSRVEEHEIDVSEVIAKANEVLFDAHTDENATTSTPRVQPPAEIHTKLDELHRQNASTNKKLDKITSKLGQLDKIEHKLTKLDKTVSELGVRVGNVESKHLEFEKSVEFLSSKFDAEVTHFSKAVSDVRERLENQGKEIRSVQNELSNAKQINVNVKAIREEINKLGKEMSRHSSMIEGMAYSLDSVRREKVQTDERITDLQYRSMKMNLVFTGLGGESRNEDTEFKLRDFLKNELNIDYNMEFANVHRFGRFQRGKNRPIVARFIYQTNLDTVMERTNWLWRTGCNVHRQFPAAME